LGGGGFDLFFLVHTSIYIYLFLIALRELQLAPPHPRGVAGARLTKVALFLLALDYLHYAPLFWVSSSQIVPLVTHLEYAPFYDLSVLVALMFGMVMLVTGQVQRELEEANTELTRARDRLETMAHLDHLTSALTRHAFYSLIEDPKNGGRAILRGCAAVVDIDQLKAINDKYGHPVGDAAIRAVAAAIRGCIRADDLLFRWGGDEFLVLLIGVSESEARARLDGLNHRLRQTSIGLPAALDVSASVGYAPFDSASSLDEVIAVADTAMYGVKKASA
jgi:diguanylate cyclase (GGDEF)-like protein